MSLNLIVGVKKKISISFAKREKKKIRPTLNPRPNETGRAYQTHIRPTLPCWRSRSLFSFRLTVATKTNRPLCFSSLSDPERDPITLSASISVPSVSTSLCINSSAPSSSSPPRKTMVNLSRFRNSALDLKMPRIFSHTIEFQSMRLNCANAISKPSLNCCCSIIDRLCRLSF